MLDEISAEDEELIKNSFLELKSVCDELVKKSTSENCVKFITIVDKTPNTAINYLLEYSVFPLQLHLCKHISKKSKLSTSALIDLLKCLKKILSKMRIRSANKFLEYSILLLKIVLDFDKQEIVEGTSEDVKFGVIDCLLSLYEDVDDGIIPEIYDRSKRNNCHPQAVYFCTLVARNEQLLKLRTSALRCLLAVARVQEEEYPSIRDEKLKQNVTETIAVMFPGIISACHFIIVSDSITHHSLFVYAVRVFSRIVTSLFENNTVEISGDVDFTSKMSQLVTKIKPIKTNSSTNSILTEDWYQEANIKLITCTKGLIPICDNLHWKVRLELVKSAHLMLTKCSSNIKAFSTTLVEILIILSRDSMNQVSSLAQSSLKNLLAQDTRWSQQVLEFLEENLCTLLDSIILSLNAADEGIFLSHLNLLNGYLNILDLQRVLKSSHHLQRLVSTLIKIIRFDPSSLNSFHELRIQELGISDYSAINIQHISWKNSKYLNCQTETAVRNICQTVSAKIDIQSIAFYLLDLFESNIEDRKEVIYLINNLVLNSTQHYTDEYFNLMKSVLKTYLDPVYWSVPVSSKGDDFFDCVPLSITHSNILQVCLLTEGIGNMAESLQTKFNPLLLFCLYSVIENAGNPNEFISSAGLETIKKITSSCGYPSITELITDNVDYVTHHVTVKLRNLNQNRKVFDVLDVIILHCEQQSLSVLCDIIETLLRSSDILSDKFRAGFLNVFRSFVRKIRKWFAPLFNDDMSALNESDERHFEFLVTVDKYVNRNKKRNVLSDSVKDEEVNLDDIFKTAELDYSDADDNDELNEEEPNPREFTHEDASDETEKPIPQHIQLIISVANRLVHILSTKCVMEKILVIEILMDSLLILCDEENQLLPVVHKIWSPLVNRFKYDNKDSLILRRCFELLCIMAVTARDFITGRTLKEVLPILNEFLYTSPSDSKLKDKKSIYRMSQKYKLQRILLKELGHLSVYICLQEKELNSVLTAASPYLSSRQPLPLQMACTGLFEIVASRHFEFVWIHLMSVYPYETVFVPSDALEFQTISIEKNEDSEEFRKNVTSLFKTIK